MASPFVRAYLEQISYTQYDQYRPINTVQFGGLVQISQKIAANSPNYPKNTGQICRD